MFPKPKDIKKPKTGVKIKKDGREVLSPVAWRKRRWELFVECDRCFRCGERLSFGNVNGVESGGAANYHAHHSQGRGLGGSKRDDRIFIPGGFDPVLIEEYPYMPEPPEGLVWNLYPLCNECHTSDEHDQGCAGELQWGQSNLF
jgi:hypothetical protein